MKLREVSASYQLPDSWVRRARMNRASLTVAGRNLRTWTDYNGADPEVRGATGSDQGMVPALTQFITSLTITF